MTVRALIVDDEAPARRRVRALLGDRADVTVLGEAANGLEAVDAIRESAPDLVFLDVQMPGMSGFEVIQAIGADVMPPVIFATAHDEFAVAAFAVEAVDYLVKPLGEPRFSQALERALRRIVVPDGGREAAMSRLLGSVLPERRFLERLIVRKEERLLFVPVAEVERLSADANYVEVHTPGGTHLIRETLAHLEARLDPQRFVRVHRGEIVAIAAVREVHPQAHGDSIVVLASGACVRMSRRYADRLLGAGEAG